MSVRVRASDRCATSSARLSIPEMGSATTEPGIGDDDLGTTEMICDTARLVVEPTEIGGIGVPAARRIQAGKTSGLGLRRFWSARDDCDWCSAKDQFMREGCSEVPSSR